MRYSKTNTAVEPARKEEKSGKKDTKKKEASDSSSDGGKPSKQDKKKKSKGGGVALDNAALDARIQVPFSVTSCYYQVYVAGRSHPGALMTNHVGGAIFARSLVPGLSCYHLPSAPIIYSLFLSDPRARAQFLSRTIATPDATCFRASITISYHQLL